MIAPHRATEPLLPRVAAIDVGTNSIRLVVAEALQDGAYRVLDDEKETARLGEDLSDHGRLSPEAMDRGAAAIERMARIAASYGVTAVRAVGTCAVREASNRDEFLAMVKRRAGLSVQVIDAEEEARLAFSSVSQAFEIEPLSAAVADIGGGSTELVLSAGGIIERIHALPLGAVRLTGRFNPNDSGSESAFRKMRAHVESVVCEKVDEPPFRPSLMFGTGGTFTALAKVALRRGDATHGADRLPFALFGHEMSREEVVDTLEWLRRMPLRERARVPGISAQRAEIFVAGLTIVEALMDHLRVDRLKIHDGGIRDGLIIQMFDDLFPGRRESDTGAAMRMRNVRRFARACHYDLAHSEHVTRLALQIFDRLAPRFDRTGLTWANPHGREMLEAGAVLHDVGQMISYARHHKHSYDLIVRSGLPGFSRREIRVIANIARYHRKARPKERHPGYSKLSNQDQRSICHLAGILRIADGLDRDHTQRVRSVATEMLADAVRFTLTCHGDESTNVAAAVKKGNLFLDAFKTRIEFAVERLDAARKPAAEAADGEAREVWATFPRVNRHPEDDV